MLTIYIALLPKGACGGAGWVSNTTHYDCCHYRRMQERNQPARHSRLLYVRDFNNDLMFLVDTVAEVSVIPPPHQHSLTPSPSKQHSHKDIWPEVSATQFESAAVIQLDLHGGGSEAHPGSRFPGAFQPVSGPGQPETCRQLNIADGRRISLQVEANDDSSRQNASRDGGQDNGEISDPQQAGKFQ